MMLCIYRKKRNCSQRNGSHISLKLFFAHLICAHLPPRQGSNGISIVRREKKKKKKKEKEGEEEFYSNIQCIIYKLVASRYSWVMLHSKCFPYRGNDSARILTFTAGAIFRRDSEIRGSNKRSRKFEDRDWQNEFFCFLQLTFSFVLSFRPFA